jgi:hypothetical protein
VRSAERRIVVVMSRRQRQLDELGELCRTGVAARAVDLAFEHFAVFGRDDAVLTLLAAAIEHTAPSDHVRRRFAELHVWP